MKRMDLTAEVQDSTVDELGAELTKIIESKYGGKVKELNVSNTAPKGAGTTLRNL